MNCFELRGIKKRYGARTVVDVAQLELEAGKIFALLGPNGAGKSTLLRIINLLEEPDEGELRFFGQTAAAAQRLVMARQMSMVFQRPYMFRANVFNNVAYGLKLRGEHKSAIRSKVEEALEFVGMSGFAQAAAYTLSGGESQRVALARALVLNPRVLLLDEPTANLDPNSVQMIEEIIRNSQRQFGASVLVVTHNMFQAKRLADETMLMINGQVIEKNATTAFFDHPRDERTHQFVTGAMVY